MAKNGKNPTKDLRASTAKKRLAGRGKQLEEDIKKSLGQTAKRKTKKGSNYA